MPTDAVFGGRRLVHAGLWSMAARCLGMAISFAIGVILARHLGPAGFGVYGVVLALVLLLSVVAQLGLPTLSVRELAIAEAQSDSALQKGILVTFGLLVAGASVLCAVGLVATELLVPRIFGSSPGVYAMAAPLIPLFALTALFASELRGFGRLIVGQLLDTLVRPLLVFVFALWALTASSRFDARLAIIVNLGAALITLLIAAAWVWRKLPIEARRKSSKVRGREWRRSAVPLAIVDYLRQIDGTYGVLLVGMLASDQDAGFFRLAFSTAAFAAAPLAIFHAVLAPSLARLSAAGDNRALQRLLAISACTMTGIMLVEWLFLLIAGRAILGSVFGSVYVDAWPTLLLLVGGYLISAFFGVGPILQGMSGAERALTKALALSVMTSIVVALALGLRFGAEGVGAAAIVGAAVQNLLVWRQLRKERGLDCSAMAILRAAQDDRAATTGPSSLLKWFRPTDPPDPKPPETPRAT